MWISKQKLNEILDEIAVMNNKIDKLLYFLYNEKNVKENNITTFNKLSDYTAVSGVIQKKFIIKVIGDISLFTYDNPVISSNNKYCDWPTRPCYRATHMNYGDWMDINCIEIVDIVNG